jgi:formylglycine-generating enzyme required for sulfatase activity
MRVFLLACTLLACKSTPECPDGSVRVNAGLCMDKTEVTVDAYSRCVAAGACTVAASEVSGHGATDAQIAKLGPLCNADKPDRRQHPINCVDWAQANAYCKWARGRLPSAAEWKLAAGSGPYPWGDEPPSPTRVNACGPECEAMFERTLGGKFTPLYDTSDGFEATAPVGSYPDGATPLGLLDMAGNVGEWVDDWYEAGKTRLFLGGSWDMSHANTLVIEHRGADDPAVKSVLIGFRCAH